jgi:small subunit ribosomal protein S3Ae
MVIKKLKGKQWFTVVAPSYFGSVELVQTPSSESENLIGRKLTINVADLTNDPNKFYMKITFRITRVEGEKAFTEFDEFEIFREYLARMVVHRVRRIDIIQDLKTKDGILLRVKTVVITPKKAKATIEKVMRKRVGEMIKNIVENSNLEEFVKGIVSEEIKSKIMAEAKKIYPLRNFEFRKIERM